MKFPFHLPITDRIVARRIAAEFVRQECSMDRAVRALAPGLAKTSNLGAKLMEDREVRYAIGVIMDRVEKKDGRGETFLKKMWEWLEAKNPNGAKDVEENRRTAARILAKGYIREKGSKEDEKDTAPMVIQGLGDGISNLTGETPVQAETDKEKVN